MAVLIDEIDCGPVIDVPTAVICTEQDRAIPADHQREMADLIEGCELFEYDEGHMAFMDPAFAGELACACHHVVQQIG